MGERGEHVKKDDTPDRNGMTNEDIYVPPTFMELQDDSSLNAHYRQILDSHSAFIVCVSPNGDVLRANKAFLANSLTSKRAKLTIYDYFAIRYHGELREMLTACAGAAIGSAPKYFKSVDKNGDWIAVQWELSPVEVIVKGEVQSQVLFVGRDVSAQEVDSQRVKALLDISAAQNQRLKSFTHIISHHVRSHATNITGLLELLDTSTETKEEKNEYIRLLRHTADQLEQTIRNLNQVVSIEESVSKTRSFKKLKAYVERILQLMEGKVLSTKASVYLDIPESEIVHVVPSYLNHILLNLISNALKFTSPHREPIIRIYSKKEAGFLVLSVEDNGLGLDLERFKDRLFNLYETFHRTEESRGFGLFISKIQAEAMDGKIEVESKPGQGSTFRVYMKMGTE